MINENRFMENEAIEEILRERDTYYSKIDKNFNFWIASGKLVTNSSMRSGVRKTWYYTNKMDKSNFDESVFIISNNVSFITWMVTRLGEFENLKEEMTTMRTYNSNGIYGEFDINELNNSFYI